MLRSRSTDRERGAAQAASSLGRWSFALALTISLAGCPDGERSTRADGGARASDSHAVAPRLLAEGDAGTGLVFTWFEAGGGFHVTSARSEIPEDRRAVVRVQDPSSPPLDPTRIWVADLREAHGGAYTVRQMSRAEFERIGRPPPPQPAPTKAPRIAAATDAGAAAPGDGERPQVVMYMSSSCPVCRNARTWLNRQHVSFVERNVGSDPAAAAELQQKARRAGIRADGVPVFDVGGRLIAGFDQRALSQALGL
jgi:glutaredoxin 3